LTLDDQSAKPLGSECTDNLNDAYAPAAANKLSIFNDGDAQGEWVLSVKDKKAGNVGYLEGWSLLFNAPFGKNITPGAATRSPVPNSPTTTGGAATVSPTPAPPTGPPVAATSTAPPVPPTEVIAPPPTETLAPLDASPTPAASGQDVLSSTTEPPPGAVDPPLVYYP
jgi:hypothetical protein